MESQLSVGVDVDVGCHAHQVRISDPEGSIPEESDGSFIHSLDSAPICTTMLGS